MFTSQLKKAVNLQPYCSYVGKSFEYTNPDVGGFGHMRS